MLVSLPSQAIAQQAAQPVPASESLEFPGALALASRAPIATRDHLPDPSALASSSVPAVAVTTNPLASTIANTVSKTNHRKPVHPFTQLALGVKINSLGAGFELATPLLQTLNLRAGGNFFHYSYAFPVDGVTYNAALHFASAQVSLDWFPFHRAFHLSPGFLIFNDRVSASAGVPAGDNFKLDGQTFTSSFTDPIHGDASLMFNRRFAPSLMIGFGNILPRSGRHFSVPFEVGAAYVGQPLITLGLAGTACTSLGCYDVTSDPQTRQNVRAEQNALNKDLTQLEYYPLLSTGFAYRF